MTDLLEPDRDQLEIYFDSLFRHRGNVGYLSMRSFLHNNELLKPMRSVPLGKANWAFLVDVAVDQARRAANSQRCLPRQLPYLTTPTAGKHASRISFSGLSLPPNWTSTPKRGGNDCKTF